MIARDEGRTKKEDVGEERRNQKRGEKREGTWKRDKQVV
jgi:hypothetical protein